MEKWIKRGGLIVLILVVAAWLGQNFKILPEMPEMPKGKAELSWETAEDAKNYKVHWGTSKRDADCPPGGYENSEEAGTSGKYSVENLESGKTYYFSITAVGEGGKESCFSPETQKEIPGGLKLFWENIWKK